MEPATSPVAPRPILVAGRWAAVAMLALGEAKVQPPSETGTTTRAQAQAYADAIAVIERKSVFAGAGMPRGTVTAEALKRYLFENDPFGDFLTPDEYRRFKEARNQRYAGIGLELERSGTGDVLCFPDPGGPAALAGIASGDRLLAIDGQPVGGRPLPTLVAMAAGEAGSGLRIDIADTAGGARRLLIRRTYSSGSTVIEGRVDRHSFIRIASFTPDTRQDLEFAVSRRKPRDALILDLRGNRGGDLNAAVDSAMLFLPKGAVIASVRTRVGRSTYASSLLRQPTPGPVYLWQDQTTASAAEVFIAALTENRRATSVGRRTFGKGKKQDVIELDSGAALVLTTGYLLTPSGHEIDGRGLEPARTIERPDADSADYLRVTLARSKPGH